ncbi:MAG: hypothetical protein ABWY12_06820 [Burkholderiales bacterium]
MGRLRSWFGGPSLGERLGGFIYGTIVVLSVLVVGARAYPDDPLRILLLAAITSMVFWIAHVYAHALSHSVTRGEKLSAGVVRRIALHESSVVEAAAFPCLGLLLGVIGVISDTAAVWTAFALGLVVLAVQGFVFARVERLRWPGTLLVMSMNLSLGLLLVALKVLLSH